MGMKRALGLVIVGVMILLATGTAQAVPILQLYIEGAHYDFTSESWVAAPSGSSGGGSFKLWTIGNVNGPGGAGTISDVRLSVAYGAGLTVNVTLATDQDGERVTASPEFLEILSIQAGAPVQDSYAEFEPISSWSPGWKSGDWAGKPGIPTSNGWWGDEDGEGSADDPVVKDGSWPLLSDGKELPKHGTFGEEIWWQEFYLGDFTAEDDEPIADFIPPEGYTGDFDINGLQEVYATGGQINVYEVTVEGDVSEVHFDLYNHIGSDNRAKAKFAPFSHDAHIVPEPASLAVWLLLGVLGISVAWWRRSRSVV